MKSIRFRSSVNPSPFAHLIVDDIAVAIFYSAATKRVDDDIASAFNHAVEGGVFSSNDRGWLGGGVIYISKRENRDYNKKKNETESKVETR